MSKQFRSCNLNQAYLLPPSLDDWLPEGHLARFVAEVVETLDLVAIYAKYEAGDGRGLSAYDPRMMVRVLIYGYCRGVASSRRIERATYEGVAFRYLAADQHPGLSGFSLLSQGRKAFIVRQALAVKGSIEPGKLADFLILSRDFMTIPEDAIKLHLLATYVGGRKVYTAPKANSAF